MAATHLMLDQIRLEGDPVLRQRAQDVTSFDKRLEALADRMLATMRRAEGVGLAAPQIGVSRRLIVIESDGWRAALANPEIELLDGVISGREGCLSLPGEGLLVVRARAVLLRAKNLNGVDVELKVRDFEARIVQHEVDHLDGILIRSRAVSRSA